MREPGEAMNEMVQWEVVRRLLQEEKSAVAAEIEAYPRPIAGCDAQFNHLLERRRLLWTELDRLGAACAGGTPDVEAFVRASACLDDAAKRALLASLGPVEVGPA